MHPNRKNVRNIVRQPDKIKIQFLGQCIALKSEGRVSSAYPEIAQQMLRASFPSVAFKSNVAKLSHPNGLKALVRSRLSLFKPDIMVISLPAMLAAIPTGVDLINQLAPELTVSARSFLHRIDQKLTGGNALETLLKQKVKWRPTALYAPLAIDEYEALIDEAVEFSHTTSACRLILLGPGGVNEDTKTDTAGTPELTSKVNRMVLRASQRLGVAAVNASDLMAEHDDSVFLPGSNVYSQRGQEVIAREVCSVITSQISAPRAGFERSSHQTPRSDHASAPGRPPDPLP